MEQYLVLVYAGLTGSVTMITCTVLALSRLVFEYKGRSTDLSIILSMNTYGPADSNQLYVSQMPSR